MSKIEKKTVLTTAIGLAGALAFGAVNAAENPFAMQDLGKGYQVADKHMDGKCGGDMKKGKDGKCGNEKKMKDGKCGEGKCGSDKKKEGKKK